MVRLPWRKDREGSDDDRFPGGLEVEPLISCEFQDGTLFVYDDHVYVERAGPSKFESKVVPRDEITDVTYSTRIVISYLQIEQVGFKNDSGGFLTSPVDENTLHFGGGAHDCAKRAREELLFGET